MTLKSGRFLSDVTENWWNDDGCGKKWVFPRENVGFGFETSSKNEASLGMENMTNFESLRIL